MFIVQNYSVAVFFCIITMLCWGSWANTQKLAEKTWRFELFYWDYVIGILLFSVISAFTLGSMGEQGRSFVDDLKQADTTNITSAFVGGIIFNAANILFSAAIAIAGMAVAFPVAIGLALVLGVLDDADVLSGVIGVLVRAAGRVDHGIYRLGGRQLESAAADYHVNCVATLTGHRSRHCGHASRCLREQHQQFGHSRHFVHE